MNLVDELALHVQALAAAVDRNTEFFASIIHYVNRFRDLVTTARTELDQTELHILAEGIDKFYGKWRSSPHSEGIYIPPRETADTDDTVQKINRIVRQLGEMPPEDFQSLLPTSISAADRSVLKEKGVAGTPCVFIGHGRSKLWARVKILLENELGLATISYESESRSGESIIPILEKMLDQATFAILVVTAEDETAEGAVRPRQNVVHEAGLFQGRLGFPRVVLVQQEGVESFSNIDGLQYIPFSGSSIEQSFYELQRALKREGFIP